MTNGYIVLTKGEPNLYKHAVEAITLGKPIYYADGNKVAFVNSIELVSTDVVIKTSDKQITVASDGTETASDASLKMIYWDTQDFIVNDGDWGNDSRFGILTHLDITKISELPVGEYPVIVGNVSLSSKEYDIVYLEVTSNGLEIYSASDDNLELTITNDFDGVVIKL